MHVVQLSQEYFKKSLPNVHAKRLKRVFLAAESLLFNAKLAVTSLGRHTTGSAYVKNKIKAIDRILANKQLIAERVNFYKTIANQLIGSLIKIDIIVDWSPAGNHENHILRASLALEGCATVLYEEVHPQKFLNNPKIHKKFLNHLATVLPSHVRPTILTDAGFLTSWFLLVLSHGWDFEGRIRSEVMFKMGGEWQKLSSLYAKATRKAKYMGPVLLTKKNELLCKMYLYREPKKKEKFVERKRANNFAKELKRYRKQVQDPWVIVVSKSKNEIPKKIISRYKRRMKIEHEFRNNKNRRWGLGLNESRTRDPARLSILLLIAALAMLMIWIIGIIAERKLLHYRYQVNTVKNHRVLSLIFLGKQVIEHDIGLILKADIRGIFRITQQREFEFYESHY